MGIRQMKAAIIGGFALSAGIFYLSGAFGVEAQRSPQGGKRAAILEAVGGYKTWKLVSKPAPEAPTDTFRISDSSVAG